MWQYCVSELFPEPRRSAMRATDILECFVTELGKNLKNICQNGLGCFVIWVKNGRFTSGLLMELFPWLSLRRNGRSCAETLLPQKGGGGTLIKATQRLGLRVRSCWPTANNFCFSIMSIFRLTYCWKEMFRIYWRVMSGEGIWWVQEGTNQ